MQHVFVLDANENPLMPCQPARARQLLRQGRAAIYRRYPFTIILKDRTGGATQPLQFKVDPGSRTTGIALVAENRDGRKMVWAAELEHRGLAIKDALLKRRALRRGRRNRHLRYRPARFDNRAKPKGWLPPSLRSRVGNIETWLERLYRFAPITSISMELVRFDTQIMQNAEISGVEYQQGELAGYEVREYLLEKWGRKCVYCGAENVPLEIEHIVPKSRGGSNRVSNLTLSCHKCNQDKGNQTAAEYGFPTIQAKAKQPLKDAAAVNAVRWELWRALDSTGLPVEVGTGGRTKWNRARQGYPKEHWLDAACVGQSGGAVFVYKTQHPLHIKAYGHGSRQMCKVDRFGFPRTGPKTVKRVHGFQTGDMVRGRDNTGLTLTGKVAVRASGRFVIGKIDGIKWHDCTMLHHADGYIYS